MYNKLIRFKSGDSISSTRQRVGRLGKRCPTPKAGMALRVLRTFGVGHLFPTHSLARRADIADEFRKDGASFNRENIEKENPWD